MVCLADRPQGSRLDSALEKPSGRVGEVDGEILAAVQVTQEEGLTWDQGCGTEQRTQIE